MIKIKDLSIELGEFSLKDVNLSIEDGEYFIVLGPTGAGKTVLMECIAGLHRIRQGEIWLGHCLQLKLIWLIPIMVICLIGFMTFNAHHN